MKLQELKEHDVRQIGREATIKVATFLKIDFPELRDNIELENMIKEKNEDLYCLLTKFNDLYFNYYYFCKSIGANNKRNDLNEKDEKLIQGYIQQKDAARKMLLEAINFTFDNII